MSKKLIKESNVLILFYQWYDFMLELVITITSVLLLLFISRVIFYLLTRNKLEIKIVKKYSIKMDNTLILKFFGENKIEYVLTEDIMLSKAKCIDLWNSVNENEIYTISYYGVNIPCINMNYKIYDIWKN